VRCPSCGTDNRADARFCEQCGIRLSAMCGGCGAALRPSARFCDKCGTPVGAPVDSPKSVETERRQVTVMFCDLVDSTALAEHVDPEELRDVVRAYHDLCAREVTRFGGHVAQYLGDGVLAYFGYPVARDNDAQAAVRAGLAITAAMAAGGDAGPAVRVPVRVGIHSGLVVTGDVGSP